MLTCIGRVIRIIVKMLANDEPRVEKISRYQVKYLKKSRKHLNKYFNKETVQAKCFRDYCDFCVNTDPEEPSLCQEKG